MTSLRSDDLSISWALLILLDTLRSEGYLNLKWIHWLLLFMLYSFLFFYQLLLLPLLSNCIGRRCDDDGALTRCAQMIWPASSNTFGSFFSQLWGSVLSSWFYWHFFKYPVDPQLYFLGDYHKICIHKWSDQIAKEEEEEIVFWMSERKNGCWLFGDWFACSTGLVNIYRVLCSPLNSLEFQHSPTVYIAI